ncbi:MAG: Cupin 2, conserved barrel [Solirubrobacterales bacterium]|nr:Cupin 2, conserved barrel [Solirubrobacterales bacterium]
MVDLLSPVGTGPLWGLASADLNATLLVWEAGHEIARHVNAERDVLLVVLEGTAEVVIGDEEHHLAGGSALLVERGASRVFRAGAGGVRVLSVHRARGPLQIQPA